MDFLFSDLYFQGLQFLKDPMILLVSAFGTLVGIVFGALPGLTSTMTIAVFISFTFGVDPITSFAFLLALYMGSVYGGSISAILVNIPGTPNAVATSLDGYPLSQKGKAGEAIGVATISSAIGGIVGIIVLSIAAPLVASFALKFSAQEYVGVALLGISIIALISHGSMIKGLISGVIGLLIGTVGLDMMVGYPRFIFGRPELLEGLSVIPVMIGLYGLAEMFEQIAGQDTMVEIKQKLTNFLPPLPEFVRMRWTYLRASVSGVIIGAIPAAGGSIASLVAYGQEKQFSKRKELLGTGIIDGVAAPEAANNACVSGALIPMLTLGIPGDPMTAVLMGGLIIQGLQPGPMLFTEQMPFVSSIFISLFLAVIFMAIFGLVGARWFAKLITIPKNFLIPAILTFCLVGSYAINNSLFDVGVLIVSGIIGFGLKIFGFPAPPIILGLILGPIFESNLRRALMITNGDWSSFVTRPISLVFLIAVTFVLFGPAVMGIIKRNKNGKTISG